MTVGPRLTFGGNTDAFVAKVKADGTGLIYCGYIGGAGEDQGTGIAVDSGGHAYVSGGTSSDETSFPVTVGPGLTFKGGGLEVPSDAFVAKVTADGTGFVYAGYIGGTDEDFGTAIAVDSAGSAYVAGLTRSSPLSFPVTVGPSLTFSGDEDAFVAKVKADGSGLIYAGYIGGASNDEATAIAVDSTGSAYVAGFTGSSDFPTKVGPQLTYNGNGDAFVAKVKADGTTLVYAGYIGGSEHDSGHAITVDSSGAAYVAGRTLSPETSFPVRLGPGLVFGGSRDAFVAKVRSDGSGLLYAGYIGGRGFEEAVGIARDSAGNLYVAGWTDSDETSFPVKAGPDVLYNGGTYDAFVVKLSGKPDLVEGGFLEAGPSVIPSVVKPGSSFLVNDVVANHGLGTAPASTTRYYLSVTGTGKDKLIGSGSVPSLVPDDGFIAGVTVTVPTSTALNSYFVLACADAPDTIDELDETNNCKASSHKVTVTLPDLRVTSVTNPRSVVKPGDRFSVTDTVQNFGSISAGASTVRYYFSADAHEGSDKLLAGTRAVGLLNAGASSTNTVSVTVPTTLADGFYFLLACADDLSKVSETSETNNCLASGGKAHVARPDLVESAVADPPASKKPGESFSATDTVTNSSIVSAAASTTRYYLSTDGVKKSHLLTGSRAVGTLSPFNFSQGTVSVTIPGSTPLAAYFLLACADDLKKVDESSETNNCKAATNKITVAQ